MAAAASEPVPESTVPVVTLTVMLTSNFVSVGVPSWWCDAADQLVTTRGRLRRNRHVDVDLRRHDQRRRRHVVEIDLHVAGIQDVLGRGRRAGFDEIDVLHHDDDRDHLFGHHVAHVGVRRE